MKLSILIPMYNSENYIGYCLKSLVNQDLPKSDYEIIVMDDGSTDDSTAIVEDFQRKHPNIKLYRQENAGIFETRNRLLKLATGTYLYNLDSDDYIVCNSLKTILSYAIERDAEVLGFKTLHTKRLDLYEYQQSHQLDNIDIQTGIEFWHNSKLSPSTGIWWYLVKSKFIQESNILFEPGNPMADSPFTFKLFSKAQRVLFLPMDVHRYVQVSDSIMNNRDTIHLSKMINHHIDLIKRFNKFSEELNKSGALESSPKTGTMVNCMKFWSDVNVYWIFKKLFKTTHGFKEINNILGELKTLGAYPMKNFSGKYSFSKKNKLIAHFLNQKYLYFIFLYPLRFLDRIGLIKIPVQ